MYGRHSTCEIFKNVTFVTQLSKAWGTSKADNYTIGDIFDLLLGLTGGWPIGTGSGLAQVPSPGLRSINKQCIDDTAAVKFLQVIQNGPRVGG